MILITLFVLGLILGSFINALVWRIHEREKNIKPKDELSILKGRSMCPKCHHRLAAKDLIPVLSWLSLRGVCRYCHKPISWQYPSVELATALLFVLSYIFWPTSLSVGSPKEWLLVGLWLIFLTGFVALAVYDLLWFVLPNQIIYPLIGLALLQLAVVSVFYGDGLNSALGGLWGILVLAGLFFGLYQISNGSWIGGGDVRLGVVIGLLVGGPSMSVLVLFSASVFGSLLALPLLLTGRAKRTSRLPFGPFLILATIVVRLFGASLIAWYKRHLILS